jgi:predicted permease
MAVMPGVRSATVLMDAPLGGTSVTMNIGLPGQPKEAEEQANFNFVGPRFLETMGIPLVEGRDIQATDSAAARPVAVISESLASRLFRGRHAVGESIQAGGRLVEIVGVAKGVTYAGVRDAKEMMVYRPYVQEPAFVARVGLTLALRTEGAPGLLAEEVRRGVREVAPNLLVSSMTTLDARFDGSIATERLLATISGFLGVTALLLVAIGVYGTLAYAVAQRTRELGVRVALGATGADIARLVLGGALMPVCAGVGIGLPIALWLSRIAQGVLFGITAGDPATYATSTAVLLTVATLAATLPARAAVQADPTTSLRQD